MKKAWTTLVTSSYTGKDIGKKVLVSKKYVKNVIVDI
jgi:hypothetical protein